MDFKPAPHDVFGLGDVITSNALRFRIYPESHAVLTLVGRSRARAGNRKYRTSPSSSTPARTCAPTTG
jgi:hypothetical protein